MRQVIEIDALGPIPCTYVYVGQLQEAAQALARALDATSDQRCDGAEAARCVVRAREHIENIYKLQSDGVES